MHDHKLTILFIGHGKLEVTEEEAEGDPEEVAEEEAEIDEEVCQECGANYNDDDKQDAWIGCDNEKCGRWFHYWCAGFKRKPTSRKKFKCLYC